MKGESAQILCAGRIGRHQRCGLDPILVGRKDFHGKRTRVGSHALGIAAIRPAGNRVRRRDICERKAAFHKKMILPVALGSSRLRPPVIHTDAVTGSDPLHQAVEDLFPVLCLIEAEITKVVQETAGLRDGPRYKSW